MNQIKNRDIRDEIRDYWSARAETFDNDPGHKIADGDERRAWMSLFLKHLGDARGRRLLDLASGTGEIAMLCHDMGFRVTGLDWAEPMLARARAKAKAAGADITFLQADAEIIPAPSGLQDVIVTRHLVWTLVDPLAAFKEWRRLLAPNGILLIVDGDFVSKSLFARVLSRVLGPVNPDHAQARNWHQEILSQVYFANGARAEAVADLLRQAGFSDVRIDSRLSAVHRAQARQLGWRKSLMRRSEHRYVIMARR
ncbi:class I SAM-dependent methyltransferase [Marivivens sp. LCG002]|uniref:class I SAM-dependent methyltransferase n=1 Tax=Marivivens sp. LCG002 TaxID=3051171 RepID=UPI0025521B9E|nr:class I SAM-dependent methyltransferase [Marivivens sp. LCG002]WIV49769.1 class I SAM-dependent methyltransferase [Marivivens sp. LCG002]